MFGFIFKTQSGSCSPATGADPRLCPLLCTPSEAFKVPPSAGCGGGDVLQADDARLLIGRE